MYACKRENIYMDILEQDEGRRGGQKQIHMHVSHMNTIIWKLQTVKPMLSI